MPVSPHANRKSQSGLPGSIERPIHPLLKGGRLDAQLFGVNAARAALRIRRRFRLRASIVELRNLGAFATKIVLRRYRQARANFLRNVALGWGRRPPLLAKPPDTPRQTPRSGRAIEPRTVSTLAKADTLSRRISLAKFTHQDG